MAAHQVPRPWDSPGKNTGVDCHCLLQCMKVKSESEIAQSYPTLRDPMDYSLLLPRLLQPWNFPGKSTGVGCHCLLRINILLTYKMYLFHPKSSISALALKSGFLCKYHLNLWMRPEIWFNLRQKCLSSHEPVKSTSCVPPNYHSETDVRCTFPSQKGDIRKKEGKVGLK